MVLLYSPVGVASFDHSPPGLAAVSTSRSSVEDVLAPDLAFRGTGAGFGSFLLAGGSSNTGESGTVSSFFSSMTWSVSSGGIFSQDSRNLD